MDRGRRRFLKAATAAGVGAALIGAVQPLTGTALSPPADTRDKRGVPNRKWVMVIDLERCDGCKKCTEACNAEHFVPPGQEWIKVFDEQTSPIGGEIYLPRPCMQCENPPCVKVCPVDATYRRDDGVVLIDHDRCIGCRFCMAACPYNARSFNWSEPPHPPGEQFVKYSPEYPVPHRTGTVEKCMFCAHRVAMGRLPACVEACTKEGMKAIYFGDLNEDVVTNGSETVKLSELIESRHGNRYKEELGTHPRVFYLPAGPSHVHRRRA